MCTEKVKEIKANKAYPFLNEIGYSENDKRNRIKDRLKSKIGGILNGGKNDKKLTNSFF